MKCTRCKGKGKFIGYYVNDNPVECECVICKGAGEVQMTEQEYIQTCNTKQLAEWIVRIVDCEFCPVKKPCKKQPCKKQIEMWLKQPHTTIKE